MSKLHDLINKYCPNGVEYNVMSSVITAINTGLNPRKFFKVNTDDAENYYVTIREMVNGEIVFCDRTDRINDEALKLCDNRSHLDENTVLFSGTGTVGRIVVLHEKPRNWNIKEGVYAIHPIIKKITPKFLGYVLQSSEIKSKYVMKVVGGTVQSIPMKDLANLEIPVPPLPVQEEIVRILDSYTRIESELEVELADELEMRKKQYEYYNSSLFDFKERIPVCKIGDFTKVFSASRVHKSEWKKEGVPFWRSSDLMSYHNGVKNSRGEVFISEELYEKLSAKSGKIEKDDLLITGGGSIGIPYIVPTNDPLYVKDADLLCIKKNKTVLSKYLYYYFLSQEFRDYLKSITHDATIAHYTITQIKETPIPIPPIETQKHIVDVLDKYSGLQNDILKNLPTEIKLRHQQYEYYRDKLLTFKRVEAV